MKYIIVGLLIISIVSAQWTFPRDPDGCKKKQTGATQNPNKQYYFDQKCEHCTDYCDQCSDWNKCSQCSSTYSPLATTTGAATACLPCFNTFTGTAPFGQGEGVTSCCQMQDTLLTSRSFHAKTCDATQQYFLYGSYCIKIPNCKIQTPQYTKCQECVDGYYLNLDITGTNDQCQPCGAYIWDNSNDGNTLTYAATTTVGGATIKICKQCRELNQCTVCADGFYLKTDYNRNVYEKTILKFASVCAPCLDPNCKTCPEGDKCSACNDGYYWNPISLRCYQCGDTSKQKIYQKLVLNNYDTTSTRFWSQDTCSKAVDTDFTTYPECKDWFAFYFSVYGCNTCSFDTGSNKVKCNTCQNGFYSYSNADGTQLYCTRINTSPADFQTAFCQVTSNPVSTTCTPATAGGSVTYTEFDIFMMNLASEDNLYVLGVGTDLKIGQFGLLGTYDIPFFNTVLQPSECGDIKIISSKGTIIRADKTYYDPSTKTAYSATAVTRTFFFFNCNSCNNGLAIKLISDPDTGATSGLIIPQVLFSSTVVSNQCQWCQTLITDDDRAANVADFTSTQFNYAHRCEYVGAGQSSQNYPNKKYKITLCGDIYTIPVSGTTTQYSTYRAPLRGTYPHDNEYYLITSKYGNTCVQNKNSCKLLVSDSTQLPAWFDANQKCDTCYDGYSKSAAGKCIKCPAASDLICNKCEVSFTGDTPKCLDCKTGLNRGKSSDPSQSNYYVAADGTCKACDNNCLKCDATGCSDCQYGYMKDANKQCIKCTTDNCQACSDAATCTKCFNSFTLISATKQCQSCDTGCLVCNGDQRKTCTQCANGFYLDTGKCRPKRDGCLEYDQNGGKCTKCIYGYRINDDGWCMQCISIEGGFYNCPQNCVFDSPFTNTGKSSATPKTVLRNLADLLEDEQL